MIDIIIPCYNSKETLKKTLDSIVFQTIKDKVNVLIVDDNSTDNYDSIINFYKKILSISILRLNKNGGSGIARENGLSHTHNPYIVFMDSDDRFFKPDSLELLYNKIEENYDYVNSIEYDQKRNNFFLLNGNVHGKIYRRKYLEQENIHFNKSRFHEDNYFNNLVILSGANYTYINECTYFYSYNEESITNKDYAEFEKLKIYLKNMYDLLLIVKERGYSNIRLNRFLREKYRYLYRIYHEFDEKQQSYFRKWVRKYDPHLLKIINYDKTTFLEYIDQCFLENEINI